MIIKLELDESIDRLSGWSRAFELWNAQIKDRIDGKEVELVIPNTVKTVSISFILGLRECFGDIKFIVSGNERVVEKFRRVW